MRLLITCISVLLSCQLNAQSNKRADSLLNIAQSHFKSTHKMQRDESRELYINAANAGSAYAMYELYHSYRFGMNLAHRKDEDKAKEWLLKCAEAGYVTCRLHLADAYLKKDSWLSYDVSKSMYWSEKAAETGNQNAEVELAEKYVHGDRRFRNYTKARELCKKNLNKPKQSAAVQKANEILGDIYSNGLDVTKDGQKAIGHYEKAIGILNELEMRNKIGEIYLYGKGIEQDYKKAKNIFEEIYSKDRKSIYSAIAANNLGKIYYTKETGYTNEDLAMFYFEQAAKGGMQDVLEGMISYYYNKDEKKTIELLELSASSFQNRSWYYGNVEYKHKKSLVNDMIRYDQYNALKRLGGIYYNKKAKADKFNALGYYEQIVVYYSDLLGNQQDKICRYICNLRKEYAGSSLWLDYTERNTKRSAKAIKTCKCY